MMATMKTLLKLTLLFASATALFAQSSPADRILGAWSTPKQESTVQIVKCGDAYCGSIQSMKTPTNDEHNADPSLRSRPLVGAQIMTGFQYAGSNTWNGGALYAPRGGKNISPDIVLTTPDSLDIKIKKGLMSKSVTWKREK